MYFLLLLAQNLPTELQVCPHPQTHWVGVFWGQTPGGLAVSQVKSLLMSSRKGIKVLDPLNTILAAHTRKTLMEPLLQIPEGMSIRFLNLMKGYSKKNQASPGHHLREEIILNLIHLNSVMNIKPNSFKH